MILVWEKYKPTPRATAMTYEEAIGQLPVEAGRQHKRPRVESTVATNVLRVSNSLGTWYLQEVDR